MKELNISECYESTTNPRGRNFAGPTFDELVASIKVKGVLQPVLAREKAKGKLKYEIIAGARRLRASMTAGRKTIPAMLVVMNDEEAREAQIIENAQREDIHPIDEAFAFRDLVEKHKKEVADIAARVGKSETHVRNRLLLTDLIVQVQNAVRKEQLPLSHALVIARLEKTDQLAALKHATRYGRVCSISEMRKYVSEHVFNNAMKNPPWKTDSAAKVEIAKMLGKKGDIKTLFGDDMFEEAENPAQFARALAAYLTLKINEYRENGKPLTLVSSNYSSTSKNVKGRNEYDTMDQAYFGDKKCKSGHDAIIVEGTNAGKIIKICTDKGCKAHNEQPKKQLPVDKKKRAAVRKAEAKKIEEKNKAIAKTFAKVKWPLNEKQLDALFDLTFDRVSTAFVMPVCRRHGFKADVAVQKGGWKSRDYHAPLRRYAIEGGNAGKLRMIFELLSSSSSLDETEIIKKLKNL